MPTPLNDHQRVRANFGTIIAVWPIIGIMGFRWSIELCPTPLPGWV
jgi:hypothetical protein